MTRHSEPTCFRVTLTRHARTSFVGGRAERSEVKKRYGDYTSKWLANFSVTPFCERNRNALPCSCGPMVAASAHWA